MRAPGTGAATAAATCEPGDTTVSSPVVAGGVITVSSPGWEADTDVASELHSDPVALGPMSADVTGLAAGRLTVPLTVPPGAHELVLTGTDTAGLARTVRVPVTVTAAAPAPGTGPSGTSGLPITGAQALKGLWSATSIAGAGAMFSIAAARRRRLGLG